MTWLAIRHSSSSQGNQSTAWEIPVCHFRNLCARTRSHGEQLSNTVTYAFAADSDVTDLSLVNHDLAPAFEACMLTKYRKKVTLSAINLETYQGPVEWVRGKTLGFRKSEGKNHPGAWGRIWASLAAAGTYGPDIFLGKGLAPTRMFNHIQLFESSIDLNSYSCLMMEATLRLLQQSLARREKSLRPPSFVNWVWDREPVPSINALNNTSFGDARNLYGEDKTLVCFEDMFTVPESYDYFRSQEVAAHFRSLVLQQLNLPDIRHRRCYRRDMKIVYLKRPERRVWNEDAMLSSIRLAGFSVIDTVVIDESTPAEEQVRIFYDADVLISIHGSQLQSQYYMQPRAALVEIYPKNYIHWNQAALAQHTGIDHVELINNTFPPEDLVKSTAPHLLPALRTNVQNSLKWPNAQACGHAMPCYQKARNLGAHVNIDDLDSKLAELALRLENTVDCIA